VGGGESINLNKAVITAAARTEVYQNVALLTSGDSAAQTSSCMRQKAVMGENN